MQKRKIQLYSCGALIISTFFGEQLKFLSVPIYCYLIILSLGLLLIDNEYKIKISRRCKYLDLSSFSLFWILMASVTVLFTINSVGGQPYLYCVATAMLLFIVDKSVRDEQALLTLYKFALIGVITVCIVCSIELHTGNHFIPTNEYYYRMGMNNTFGFQVNVNDNASLFAACLFVPLYLLFNKTSNKTIKWLSCIGLVWSCYLIIRINSRMAILAVIVAAFIAILTFITSNFGEKGQRLLKVYVIMIFGMIIPVIIAYFNADAFIALISDPLNYANDMARVSFIQKALQNTDIFGFIFGNGAGITQYRIGYSIHCIFIEILCDYGMFVFFWLCSLLVKLFFSFANNISIKNKIYYTSFAVCFIALGFCSSSMLRIRTIWICLALVWCSYKTNMVLEDER